MYKGKIDSAPWQPFFSTNQIYFSNLVRGSVTVRPPRRFYKFRTRMMREIAGKGLKITENPCETHARNPCEVSRGSRSSRKSAKFARGFLQFPCMMGENILHRSIYTVLFVTLIERKEKSNNEGQLKKSLYHEIIYQLLHNYQ